jgi:hypothetical protein
VGVNSCVELAGLLSVAVFAIALWAVPEAIALWAVPEAIALWAVPEAIALWAVPEAIALWAVPEAIALWAVPEAIASQLPTGLSAKVSIGIETAIRLPQWLIVFIEYTPHYTTRLE